MSYHVASVGFNSKVMDFITLRSFIQYMYTSKYESQFLNKFHKDYMEE